MDALTIEALEFMMECKHFISMRWLVGPKGRRLWRVDYLGPHGITHTLHATGFLGALEEAMRATGWKAKAKP